MKKDLTDQFAFKMDTNTLLKENILLKEENEKLKLEIEEITNKLKKYTNTESHKKYYKTHKDAIIDNSNKYLQNLKETNPEKLKQYRQKAYQNRKAKIIIVDNN